MMKEGETFFSSSKETAPSLKIL